MSVIRYRLFSSAVIEAEMTEQAYLPGNDPDIHILVSQARGLHAVMHLLI